MHVPTPLVKQVKPHLFSLRVKLVYFDDDLKYRGRISSESFFRSEIENARPSGSQDIASVCLLSERINISWAENCGISR